jgi:hypothetical protein
MPPSVYLSCVLAWHALSFLRLFPNGPVAIPTTYMYPRGVHVICIHFAHPSRRFPKRGAPSHHRLAHTMMLDAYSMSAISPCLHPLYVSSRCTQHGKTSASSGCMRTTSLPVSTRRGIARLQLSQHDGGVTMEECDPLHRRDPGCLPSRSGSENINLPYV